MNFPLFCSAVFGRLFNAAAAGNFHADDRQTADLVLPEDFRQLFCIIAFIELGASDQRDAVPDKAIMKISVGIGRYSLLRQADWRRQDRGRVSESA